MAPSPQTQALLNICEELGFDDVWRSLHLSNKEYTFFSAPFGCQTRIDYFFLPITELQSVLSCRIGSIVISDHVTMIMDLKLQCQINQSPQWRLDTLIFKDNDFTSYLSTEFKSILCINSDSTDNPLLLWETRKAFARGLIMSYLH